MLLTSCMVTGATLCQLRIIHKIVSNLKNTRASSAADQPCSASPRSVEPEYQERDNTREASKAVDKIKAVNTKSGLFNTNAKSETMFMHYTISDDRSVDREGFISSRLAALGSRNEARQWRI